jgi:Tfp pilus assembly protein PilF
MDTARSLDYQKFSAKIAEHSTARHLVIPTLLLVLIVWCVLPARAQDARAVARRVLPSVVTLEVMDEAERIVSLGSGFIVRPDMVVTNYHVIRGGKSARVHPAKVGMSYAVTGVIAYDVSADLALLKIETVEGVTATVAPLVLADLSKLEVGESVYVFGSPRGLEGSVTNGILSSTSLRKHNGGEFLQITAPISHGTSGGAVTNDVGKVIGVATMWVVGGQNLNFAVPASHIEKLLIISRVGSITSFSALPQTEIKEASVCGDTPFTLPGGQTASFYIHSGEELYDRQQYAEAKEAYKRAIDIEPRNGWSHFALAHIYYKLGCDKRAVLANRQAIILEPRNQTYRDGLGWMLINSGRYGDAAGVYEEALRLEPKQATARTRLGICYISLGQVEAGIQEFKEALRVDKRCALAHFWLGKTYATLLKDRKQALVHYNAVKALDAALADELLTVISGV